MDWLQALILGIIQGLTEFLPISSSGHLIIGKELLGLEVTGNIAFETMVHCATVLSTITILRKEIVTLFLKLFKLQWNPETQYIGMIFLSMIPVMIVGLFFKKTVENLFGEGLALVGAMLLVTALLLLLSSLHGRRYRLRITSCELQEPHTANLTPQTHRMGKRIFNGYGTSRCGFARTFTLGSHHCHRIVSRCKKRRSCKILFFNGIDSYFGRNSVERHERRFLRCRFRNSHKLINNRFLCRLS